ncbi:hypothetical protein D3C87_81220 [compost metagenome]
MNKEDIVDYLNAFVVSETLSSGDAYIDDLDNVCYLYLENEIIFAMYVMKDVYVFRTDCSRHRAKSFIKKIDKYDYSKTEEVIYGDKYKNAILTIKASFQFIVKDQEMAEELVKIILNFKGGKNNENDK